VTASLKIPITVTVTALVSETRTYSVRTMRKAIAPPKSNNMQLLIMWRGLLKKMFLLNSLHGSIVRDKMAVTMAMTGATELIRLIGSFRPYPSFFVISSTAAQEKIRKREVSTGRSKLKIIQKVRKYA
jgi:hypothetical protein